MAKTNAVIRSLKIQKLLAGKSLTGMRLKDIAIALDESESTTVRTLQEMIAEGMATQFEHNGNYALSTACLAIATAHSLEVGQAQERINAFSQRVNAHAHQLLD